jgi:hypothetical protein
MLAKRGDPAEHLFEQRLGVNFTLANLLPKLARHVREANQHVIASAGEAFVHLLSERSDFDAYLLPKLSLDARKPGMHLVAHGREPCPHFGAYGRKLRLHFAPDGCKLAPHLASDGRKLGPHFGAYVREFNAHFAAKLHNLRLYRAYSLTECRDLRGQYLESFHGLLKAFYAIRQQFVRHHSSVPTRRSNSKRALDGRIKASWMPTTLPSSPRADNSFRTRTDGWRHIDALSTLEVA